MFCAVLALVGMVDANPPLPPYRRLETTIVYKQSYEPAFTVVGDMFFSASGSECVAYDLRTMKKRWTYKAPGEEGAESLAVDASGMVVTTDPAYRKQAGHLVALDPKTGKPLWSLPTTGSASTVALTATRVYAGLSPNHLSAIDRKTHKPIWTATLPKGTKEEFGRGEISAIVADANGVAVNCDAVTYGLDVATGKVRWSEPASYMFHDSFLVINGTVLVSSSEGSVARDLKTGKPLWRSATANASDAGCVFAGKFAVLDHGQILVIDPKSGGVAWAADVGPSDVSGGNQYGSAVGNLLFVRGITKSAVYNATGKELWTAPSEETLPAPCWTDGVNLVAFDGERLIRYTHGQEAAPPADSASRQQLAEKLVAGFDKLDQSDIKRLADLGDDAFAAVLKAFEDACAAHDAMGEKGDSYPLYSKYHALADVLKKVTTPKRSHDLMAAVDRAKKDSSAKPTLLSLLAANGEPKEVTPYFLRELEGVKTPGFEMYESSTYVAREYVINSSDPRAVAFMLKELTDPMADTTIRQEAYLHLAGTGGEAGLKAVLAERHGRALLGPLADRALEGFLESGRPNSRGKPLAEKNGSDGRAWGLLQSGALGSQGDLWLAEKVGGAWTNPLFAGVSASGPSRWANPAPPEATVAGKTAKQLVEGAWFDTLVKSEEIRKDTDGDGLTDVVEKRLGTDPKLKDTDGDGDSDSVDPWPNVAARPTTDAEKVLSAVFEARYHFEENDGAALFFAEAGMKPFEMPGRTGPVLWVDESQHKDWALPLEQCYEQGVAFIRFTTADRDATKPWEQRLVKWNADRTEASVDISTYYGGLNGTGYSAVLRKFGEQWVVVSMRMEYVS